MPNTDKIINKYKSFEQVSGTETTDMHRPSLGDVTLESLADKNNKQLLLSSKVRAVIQCTECQKPRCIYVASKPTVPQLRAITRVKEELGYMCGSQLFDDKHEFHSLVITRQAIGCSSHVETVYYSSTTVSFPDCCFIVEPRRCSLMTSIFLIWRRNLQLFVRYAHSVGIQISKQKCGVPKNN